jgi:hypothetical protein
LRSFRLRKRWPFSFNRGFQPQLFGKLAEDDGATRITCRIGLDWPTRIFLTVWSAGFGIISLLIVLQTLIDSRNIASLVPLVLIAAGGVLIFFVLPRFLYRNEPRFLLAFLLKTVDGRPA